MRYADLSVKSQGLALKIVYNVNLNIRLYNVTFDYIAKYTYGLKHGTIFNIIIWIFSIDFCKVSLSCHLEQSVLTGLTSLIDQLRQNTLIFAQ